MCKTAKSGETLFTPEVSRPIPLFEGGAPKRRGDVNTRQATLTGDWGSVCYPRNGMVSSPPIFTRYRRHDRRLCSQRAGTRSILNL